MPSQPRHSHTHTHQHKCRAELMNYAHHCGPRARARQLRFRRTESPKLKETRNKKKKQKRTTHDSHTRIGIVTTANTHSVRARLCLCLNAPFLTALLRLSLISFTTTTTRHPNSIQNSQKDRRNRMQKHSMLHHNIIERNSIPLTRMTNNEHQFREKAFRPIQS